MANAVLASGHQPLRRRDLQREQTRFDLAIAAYELAKTEGLANIRVPQIAEAVGVSPRTFNNYFASKEAAIVWPTTLRGTQLANNLIERPRDESLADALIESVAGLYGPDGHDGLPDGWLDGFRALAAAEPALHGEYLKAMAAGERGLAEAIAHRGGGAAADPGGMGGGGEGGLAEAIAHRCGGAADDLEVMVLAAAVVEADRAAVLHWFRQATPRQPLAEVVRVSVGLAVRGPAGGPGHR